MSKAITRNNPDKKWSELRRTTVAGKREEKGSGEARKRVVCEIKNKEERGFSPFFFYLFINNNNNNNNHNKYNITFTLIITK